MKITQLTGDISPKKAKEARATYYKRHRSKGKSLKQVKKDFAKNYKHLNYIITTYEQKMKSKTDLTVDETYKFIRSKYLSEENILKAQKALGKGYTKRDAEKFIKDSIKIQLGLDISVRIDTAFKTIKDSVNNKIPVKEEGRIVMKPKTARTAIKHVNTALEHLQANLEQQQWYIDTEFDRRFTKKGSKRVRVKNETRGHYKQLTFIMRGLQTWLAMSYNSTDLSPDDLKYAEKLIANITRVRALDMLLRNSGVNIYEQAVRSGSGAWGSDD